jgi:hypothetical protein
VIALGIANYALATQLASRNYALAPDFWLWCSLARKRAKRAIIASQRTLRSLALSQGRLRRFARLA